jgi:hypothetical protein
MKKKILSLFLLSLLIGCFTDDAPNDIVDDVPTTTYSIKNSSGINLYNVCSYYWDGSNIHDLVVHGILNQGEETGKTSTSRSKISISYSYNSSLSTLCMVVSPYAIRANSNTVLQLFYGTVVYCGKSVNYNDNNKGIDKLSKEEIIQLLTEKHLSIEE